MWCILPKFVNIFSFIYDYYHIKKISLCTLQDLSDHVKHLTKMLEGQLIVNQQLRDENEVFESD